MSEPERRLAAIVAADVVGYSVLMQEDDRAALEALTARRNLVAEAVASRRGRVVNAPGDSILAEFSSVIDAVEAALEIQRACTGDGGRMQLRIGVNIGDVLTDGAGAIYGDGVNIAARLESLAPAGGICVSQSVHDQVKTRLRLDFDDLGEKEVKNIAAPVRVFLIKAPLALGTAAPRSGSPRPNSIAVLAFDNMTGDPAQELFCDGIGEDVITDLSRTSGIAVIGRQSAFGYKGKTKDLRAIGRELGVRYVLEGSVRKSGSTVRVTAQLVEAESGAHVWANRYDRTLDDIFLVGDEITEDIVTSLDVKLSHGEEARIWRKAMRSPQARDAFNAGMNAMYLGTPPDIRRAREHFLEAVRYEHSPWAYGQAALTHCVETMQGWTGDLAYSLAEARRLGGRACELDDSIPAGHAALGIVAVFEADHEAGLERLERARELRPMCAGPKAFLAYGQMYSGQWDRAVRNAAEAVDFNPMYPLWYRYLVGAAHHFGERHESALPVLEVIKSANPRLIAARAAMIGAEMALGRKGDATAEAAAILKDRPDFSVAKFALTQPFRDKARGERYLDWLRASGLPA